MDSLTFLDKPPTGDPLPVYVVAGDEPFLKRHVRLALRRLVLGDSDDPFARAAFGEKATFAEVVAAVSTRPFLAPRRLVVVEDADAFVTANRDKLEKYVKAPSTAGVLVLEPTTWPATTKLAKALVANTITCKAPARARLPEWCVGWALERYGKQLAVGAARSLVDLVGEDMGLLDAELDKLAVYVGERARITAEDVSTLVSSMREEDVWQILSCVASGDAGGALRIVDNLMSTGGSDPAFPILGALASSLRKLAQAGRLALQGKPLGEALKSVGAWGPSEALLRHLGRHRVVQIYDWLLDANMLLRSTDHPPSELILERLIVQMARKGDAGRVQ